MIDLDPKAWRAVSGKFKIKDNGLEKALAAYEKLADDAHDECLKTIGTISQLANALKRAKDVSSAPEAAKYLAGLATAADKEKNDVAKAKAEADKAQIAADKAKVAAEKAQLVADKAKAAADKAEADEKKESDEDEPDDKEGGLKALIVSMLQKVKTAQPDSPYHYLMCEAKPFPFVMIAKQINASHRKILEKASGGSKRFLKPGTITFEDGHFCFESDKNIPGAAKRVQGFLKNLTGKKYPVMFGTAKASDEEGSPDGQTAGDDAGDQAAAGAAETAGAAAGAAEGAAAGVAAGTGQRGAAAADQPEGEEPALNMKAPFSISASVGRGGKNKPEDVQAVQTALNRKIKAGLKVDGKCGPDTIKAIMDVQKGLGKFKPDGLVEPGRGTARFLASTAPLGPAPAPPNPVPPPKLGKGTLDGAPGAWRGMHGILTKNIGELKKAVRSEYSSEHPTLLKDIEEALKKLDGVCDKIGLEISDHLAAANAAKDPAERKAKLQNCKALIASKIQYVKSEPMIAHMDRNPFGVAMNCQRMITDHLVHVAQAIGNVG